MKPRASSQDKIYWELRTAMLGLALPPGEVLHAQELASRLGVSRTPIREAFIRLQRDGLVHILPQRETTVSLIDLSRVEQEHFIRESLECSVAALLADRGGIGCLHAMNELIGRQVHASLQGQLDELNDCDNAFHRLLFEEAGQPFGWEIIMHSCPHYHRTRLLSLRSHAIIENVIMGHHELLRAFEAGNRQRLLEVLHAHLRKLDADIPVLLKMYPNYFFTGGGPQP